MAIERSIEADEEDRVYWIQGRTGMNWRNLDMVRHGPKALASLSAFSGESAYDELRLTEARRCKEKGITEYFPVCSIIGQEVVHYGNGDSLWYDVGQADPVGQPPIACEPVDDEDLKNRAADRAAAHAGEAPGTPEFEAPRSPLWMRGSLGENKNEGSLSEAPSPARDDAQAPSPEEWHSLFIADLPERKRHDVDDRRGSKKFRYGMFAALAAGAVTAAVVIPVVNPDLSDRMVDTFNGFLGPKIAGMVIADKAAQPFDAPARTLPVTRTSSASNDIAKAPETLSRQEPPLIEAVKQDDIATAAALLKSGVSANIRSNNGYPALMLAARSGDGSMVDMLIRSGANLRARIDEHTGIMHAMAAEGLDDALKRLIAAGAPVDQEGGRFGCMTPLSVAIEHGFETTAMLLAGSGASLSPAPGCLWGPLDFAKNQPGLASRLTRISGANGSDTAPDTAAPRLQQSEAAPELTPVALNPGRLTGTPLNDALIGAVKNHDLASVKSLLSVGADPTATGSDGHSAIDVAALDRNARPSLEAMVLSSMEREYRPLMFGLTWNDTRDSLIRMIRECSDISPSRTACTLDVPSWLTGTARITGQFDRMQGNRLIAIEVDSMTFHDATEAKAAFEAALKDVKQHMPADHIGFSTRRTPAGEGNFFAALQPGNATGAYATYWSDDGGRRPVFAHLELQGQTPDSGFYRLLIGNPFRSG